MLPNHPTPSAMPAVAIISRFNRGKGRLREAQSERVDTALQLWGCREVATMQHMAPAVEIG